MAASGKKGKKTKGKTMALTAFLGDVPKSQPMPRKNLWSDDTDFNEPIPAMHLYLPTAPRAARGQEIDESRIPKNGPYMAHISNLPYEIEDADIYEFFKDFSVVNLRLPKDDRGSKIRGFGYVEFEDKASLVGALQITDTSIKGRPIRIEISDSNSDGSYRRGGGMRDRDRDRDFDSRMQSCWRERSEPSFGNDDRRSTRWDHGGFKSSDRDRDRDRDREGNSESASNWREGKRAIDDKPRDSWDSRNAYSGGPRRNYGGDRDRFRDGSPPGERVRPKLNLKPLQDLNLGEGAAPPPAKAEENRPSKPSAASIFGDAKPVDTAAREREIEERLAKDRVAEPPSSAFKPEPRDRSSGWRDDRDREAPAPPENAWTRRSQQKSDGPPSRSRDDDAHEHGDESDRSRDNEDYHPRSEEETSDNETARDSGHDKKKEAREENDNIDRRDVRQERDRHDDIDERDRQGDRDERDRVRRDDRDRRDDSRDRPRDDYRDRGRDRYMPPSRDYDKREYSRDRDRDRGFNRDYDRDRGFGNYRDNDRDYRRDRDYNRDRDRVGYRDRDRYRGRDSDKSRDYDRSDRPVRDSDRDRPRDVDRVRDSDKDRDDRRRQDSREREDKDRDRRGNGGRPAGKATELKDRPKEREPRPPKEIPKVKEPVTPNYVAQNKYSTLVEDGASE